MQDTALIPIAEYLEASYRPDCDYVDGRLVERNVGERDHSKIQGELFHYLRLRRRALGIHAFVEQRVQVSPTRFRVPDVCVVAGQEPADQIFHQPPLLCVEILSRSDRRNDMQERIDDYLNFGVKYVWVINPQARQAWVHTTGGTHEVKDGILRTENPSLEVPLTDLFAELD
jgi:Uma2 family endonuclease